MLRGWVALTGTPGVGKSSAAAHLAATGVAVVDLARVAAEWHLLGRKDPTRASREVDPRRVGRLLQRVVPPKADAVLDGHWGHEVPGVKAAIVLRARPGVLEERLRVRGWTEAKIRENVEAEAIGVILQEAAATLGRRRTFDVDATGLSPPQGARAIRWILDHPVAARKKFEVGCVDWTQDILEWF